MAKAETIQTPARDQEQPAKPAGQGDGALNFTFMFRDVTPEQLRANAASFGDLDSSLVAPATSATPAPKS